MEPAKYVAYYRVSTDRQGRSGLGLDAQRQAVESHLAAHGGELLASYKETESGKRSDRPELAAALEQCRKERATLVIAKLDRLGRNVAFIASLMDSRVDFVACDNPHASRFMLHIMAAFAEHEREQISKRTKEALAALKARGVRLGNPELDKLNAKHQSGADAFAVRMAPVIEELQEEGVTTVQAIRDELNRRDVPTARGGNWHLPTVHRLMKRLERLGV
jgi:DNA invertase Pin-like site-specific DNA recombinase